jgi:hypothetical protein
MGRIPRFTILIHKKSISHYSLLFNYCPYFLFFLKVPTSLVAGSILAVGGVGLTTSVDSKNFVSASVSTGSSMILGVMKTTS